MPDPARASNDAGPGLVSIRRYIDTPPEMRQPALSDNLICLHLGGAKEVRRWHDGRLGTHSVELGALTIMPANQANRWLTRGPIDFAHLMISPKLVAQLALEECDNASGSLHLLDTVGFRDPYLGSLFTALLKSIEGRAGAGRLYPDSLLTVLVVTLLKRHSTLSAAGGGQSAAPMLKGGIAAWRLRRVTDYMVAHCADDIALTDLASLSGLSRAQFFRSFKQSTGLTPHHFLTALRLDAAQTMLDARATPLAEVGARVGLSSPVTFTAHFKRRFGVTPRAYLASTG